MNKSTYIIGGITLILVAGISFFIMYIKDISHIVKTTTLEIDKSNQKVTFNDSKIQKSHIGKYDYYQAYLYPKEFEIKCTNNTNTCKRINNNIQRFEHFSLDTISKKIQTSGASDISLDIGYLQNKRGILNNIFTYLYTDDSLGGLNSSPMMNMCVEGIKQTLTRETENYEHILSEMIKSECSGLENISETQTAFGGNTGNKTDEENTVFLSIGITQFKVKYVFFSKENGKYIEKTTEEKTINENSFLSGEILLSEL